MNTEHIATIPSPDNIEVHRAPDKLICRSRAELATAVPFPPSGVAPTDPLAEAAEISGRAFSERMLRALDKYQAMSTLPPRDAGQAPRVDARL